MLTGTNLTYTRRFNLRIVHEVVRLYGPLSRADVARRTQLTVQTVSNLVKELVSLELVREGGRRQEGRGAPSTSLSINPDGAFALGLDLDRDHLTGVLVDLAGAVRRRRHRSVESPSPERALELVAEMVEALIAEEGLSRARIAGVGVGIPGPMRHASAGGGYVVSPKALAGWQEVPFADLLEERLGLPVRLENNATAAAVGERWYGAGRAIGTFFYVYFGSGLGGGLVTNGQPYEGFTGNAGEIGYLPTVLAGGPPADADSSHVGMHFNLPRLLEALRRAGARAESPDDLDRLLGERHPALVGWLDAAADHLTGLVLAVEYLVDPEAVFFGGRLPERVLRALMERVAIQLPERRIGGKSAGPQLLLATSGVDAAALGVATLPIYESFAPAPRVLQKRGRRAGNGAPAGALR